MKFSHPILLSLYNFMVSRSKNHTFSKSFQVSINNGSQITNFKYKDDGSYFIEDLINKDNSKIDIRNIQIYEISGKDALMEMNRKTIDYWSYGEYNDNESIFTRYLPNNMQEISESDILSYTRKSKIEKILL